MQTIAEIVLSMLSLTSWKLVSDKKKAGFIAGMVESLGYLAFEIWQGYYFLAFCTFTLFCFKYNGYKKW